MAGGASEKEGKNVHHSVLSQKLTTLDGMNKIKSSPLFFISNSPLPFLCFCRSLFAGTPPPLRASPPCCHGDESRHKCQAGGYDVSQDLHPEARQCEVGERERDEAQLLSRRVRS